jgi:hypothetical protein
VGLKQHFHIDIPSFAAMPDGDGTFKQRIVSIAFEETGYRYSLFNLSVRIQS